MSKLRDKLKTVQLVMLMALLFCVFLCPHSADALPVDSGCETGIECLDLCHDHGSEHHHECELDGSHSHQYRDETSLFNDLVQVRWVCLAIVFHAMESKSSFQYLDRLYVRSYHTYAVRHLDKIILRV